MPRVSTDENKPIEHVTNKNVHKNYNRKARQSIGGNRKKKRRESLGYSRKNRRHTMVGLVPQFTFQKDDSSSDTHSSNNKGSLLSAGLSTITSGNEDSMTDESNASRIDIMNNSSTSIVNENTYNSTNMNVNNSSTTGLNDVENSDSKTFAQPELHQQEQETRDGQTIDDDGAKKRNDTADLGSIASLFNANENMTNGNVTATIGDFTMGNFNMSNTHMTNFTNNTKMDEDDDYDVTSNDTEKLAYGNNNDNDSNAGSVNQAVQRKSISTPELLGGFKSLNSEDDDDMISNTSMSPAMSDFDLNTSGISTKSNSTNHNNKRRETASPDTLSMLLHGVVDSDDDDDRNSDEKNNNNDLDYENTSALMKSITNNNNNNNNNNDNNDDSNNNTSMNTTSLLQKNTSMNTTSLLKNSDDTSGSIIGTMMAPKPKLKSCFSERKTTKKSNSPRVNFGSPAVAEFNRNTPPISLRKLTTEDAKKLFSMDGNKKILDDEEDDDPETAANSSVLEEAGEYSDSDDDEDDSSSSNNNNNNNNNVNNVTGQKKFRKLSMRRKSSIHGINISFNNSASKHNQDSDKKINERRQTVVADIDMSISSVNMSIESAVSVAESMDDEISFNHQGSVSLDDNNDDLEVINKNNDRRTSSASIASQDNEIQFNNSAKKPIYKEEDVVTFSNSKQSSKVNDSMNSNETEEDEDTDADDGHTAVIVEDMSLDDSTDSNSSSDSNKKRGSTDMYAESPSSSYNPNSKKRKTSTPPSRRLDLDVSNNSNNSNVNDDDEKTVELGNMQQLIQDFNESGASDLSNNNDESINASNSNNNNNNEMIDDEKTVALESLQNFVNGIDDNSMEEESMDVEEDKTIELEAGGLKALIQNNIYSDEDDEEDDNVSNDDEDDSVDDPKLLRRGSIVLNESMDITEDLGRIVQMSKRTSTQEVADALGVGNEFSTVSDLSNETDFSQPAFNLNKNTLLYSLDSTIETASTSLHLLHQVPDFAIHEWACVELQKILKENVGSLNDTIERLQRVQPAIYRQVDLINYDTRAKAKLCMELNKLVAAKEWCKWRALIEERLSKDYSDLIKKLESDISALQEESSRSDTLKQKHASELTKLKKIESFQHDIVEQQDMVTLFQQRVGKVHKHVAQTKEDISYSAAMKQDLESKIDTYDETIEKKEILSKELSSIQDVYEISKQFNSWQCNEMTADSIRFERLHHNGMKHMVRINAPTVNGTTIMECEVWMEDNSKDNYNSIFKELLSVQDVACDTMMEHVKTKLELRDAMLAMDVMFGRCRLLANEFQYIEANFTCEDIIFGRGNHISFSTAFTNLGIQGMTNSKAVPDQSEITTKWTVQFFIGFGYPAGEMEVTIKSDFGVKPIRNFDIRSFGKGFNRLLRVCNGLKELFIDSLK